MRAQKNYYRNPIFNRELERGPSTPLNPLFAVLWYKSRVIEVKLQTMIFLKTVLKKHFSYY